MVVVIRLRDVTTEDEAFLFQLFSSTKKQEFVPLGLPDGQMDHLLRMQFNAQKVSYQNQFPKAKYDVIMLEDERIGRLITELQNEELRLIDIALIPEIRGKGIGESLIRSMQRNAHSISLSVWTGNPARHLYERCGFYVTNEEGPYVGMKWDCKEG